MLKVQSKNLKNKSSPLKPSHSASNYNLSRQTLQPSIITKAINHHQNHQSSPNITHNIMLHYVACVHVREVVARRQELGKVFIEIMSNLNLFVARSIHQGSERFYSDILRGRQCPFMSFSALLPFARFFLFNNVDLLYAKNCMVHLRSFCNKKRQFITVNDTFGLRLVKTVIT
jgi:hypothetical protein